MVRFKFYANLLLLLVFSVCPSSRRKCGFLEDRVIHLQQALLASQPVFISSQHSSVGSACAGQGFKNRG